MKLFLKIDKKLNLRFPKLLIFYLHSLTFFDCHFFTKCQKNYLRSAKDKFFHISSYGWLQIVAFIIFLHIVGFCQLRNVSEVSYAN